jgi:hypothetical protein
MDAGRVDRYKTSLSRKAKGFNKGFGQMTDVFVFLLVVLFASIIAWWPCCEPTKDYDDDNDLFDWLRRNNGELYSKCVVEYHRDDVRQILNEVTGLEILPTDLIIETEPKFLERLKEMKAKGEL